MAYLVEATGASFSGTLSIGERGIGMGAGWGVGGADAGVLAVVEGKAVIRAERLGIAIMQGVLCCCHLLIKWL